VQTASTENTSPSGQSPDNNKAGSEEGISLKEDVVEEKEDRESDEKTLSQFIKESELQEKATE
jgi:hypothetical protein